MKEIDESFESLRMNKEDIKIIKEFITKHRKEMIINKKLRIYYLCYKYRFQDFIKNLYKKYILLEI